jgi:Cu-processing system ATP-binding protein
LVLITSHILSDLEELTTDVLYLQDGKVIFFQSLAELKQQTGEEKLSKAIAAIMRNETRKEMSYLKIAN